MRIGILTYDYDPPIGGLGIVAKQTKLMLERLFPDDTYLALSPSLDADDRFGFLASFRWKRRGGCPLFSFLMMFTLAPRIRKHQLDLLHVHSGSGGVFLLKKPSCKTVVTSHHTYLQEAEFVFRHAPVKRLWKTIMSRLEKRTYDIADSIVCVSQDTADFLVLRYGQLRSKITVIENAVPVVSVQRLIPKSDATILFVGRLEERKGVTVLLDAMKFISIAHPQAKLRLLGANLMGSKLWRLIAQKKLQDCVTVSGYVYDPLLFREMLNATVLVVPSLLEGFGLVAVQGMLLETCVAASDAPGLRSIVRNRETGLLFRSGDAVDCARVIGELLSTPALREKLAKQGRETALKRFSPEDRARDLHAVFERVLF